MMPVLVRGFERLGHLRRDRNGFVERDRRRGRCARERSSPSTSSITRTRRRPRSLRGRRWRRCWDGSARRASCASRWKRATRSASCANASGRTLIATSRSSRVSRARYTSPMPPAPSSAPTSKTPTRCPVSAAGPGASACGGDGADRRLEKRRASPFLHQQGLHLVPQDAYPRHRQPRQTPCARPSGGPTRPGRSARRGASGRSSRSLWLVLERLQQPELGQAPIALHGVDRHAQRIGGLLHGHAAKEAHLDHP